MGEENPEADGKAVKQPSLFPELYPDVDVESDGFRLGYDAEGQLRWLKV